MGRSTSPRREVIWWAAATAALAVAAVSLLDVLPAHNGPIVDVAGTAPSSPSRAKPALVFVAHSRPVLLRIASLNVTTRLGEVGLQPNHQVMVPASTAIASWFNLGPTPGQVGSAVILGHVDSYTGPGVFFRLRAIKVGARVDVTLANGTLTRFAVTGVVQYSKSAFPDRLVYGSRGVSALQLVTCGGVFDHWTGHYESNVVVFTKLVGVVRWTSLRPVSL